MTNYLEVIFVNKIKKGDVVARKSYNKDIIFIVDRIIDNKIVILTGITTRLKADSPIEDLVLIDKENVNNIYKEINKRIEGDIDKSLIQKNSFFKRSDKVIYTGKILHLDGDSCLDNKNSLLT